MHSFLMFCKKESLSSRPYPSHTFIYLFPFKLEGDLSRDVDCCAPLLPVINLSPIPLQPCGMCTDKPRALNWMEWDDVPSPPAWHVAGSWRGLGGIWRKQRTNRRWRCRAHMYIIVLFATPRMTNMNMDWNINRNNTQFRIKKYLPIISL